MWPSQKVIVGSTIDDWMEKISLKGEGKTHLWSISLEICYQRCINDRKLEGTVGFEFKFVYKYGMPLRI